MNIGAAFTLIRNGASIKQTDSAGGIPITRIETIANRVIDRNHMGYADIYNGDKYSSYFLRDGDILMSHINSIQHLGKAAIYHPLDEKEKIIHGMNLLVLRANQKILDNQFAYFYFSSDSFLHKLPRITKKSVNQASFTVSELKKIDIPCPALSQQHKIAKILSIIQTLCNKRNEQLKIFDELVKSRFLEMFGEPWVNDKEFPCYSVGQVAESVTYGTSAPASDSGQYEYLRMNNLTDNGQLDLSDLKRIDMSDEQAEKYMVKKGDILFNRTNSIDLVGKTALFNLNNPMIIAGYLIRIRLSDKVNPVYFVAYMNMPYMKEKLRNIAKGAVNQTNINSKELKSIQILIPPLSLQNEYCNFVLSIDKSRFLEMFGNKEYSICQLSDQCEIITKGTTPTTIGYNFTTDGVRFIKIEDITEEGKFDTAKMMHISDECNMIMKRSQLKSGDLLFSIAGAIGRCAVVTNDILPANINQALAIIRLRKDAQLSRNFLFAVLKSSYVEKQYKGLRRGGAQLNLSLKDIGNFKILLPPESEQENFIDLYKQVDKSKYREAIFLYLLEDVLHML